MPKKTLDLGEVRERFSSSLFSDALDGMGFRNQAMAQGIRPAYPGAVVAGYAHTMLMADVYEPEQDTFGLQIQGIDALKGDEVMVVASNNSTRAALWGELLSTAARGRGAAGAVIDGLVRDARQVEEMRFPVFAAGFRPVSSKGRVAALGYGCRILCGGVHVEPGDLIVGDVDGIVVVPGPAIGEAVERVAERTRGERVTLKELREGARLGDVYAKYGAL